MRACLEAASAAARAGHDRRYLAVLVVIGLLAVLPRAVIDYGQSGDALDNARDALLLAERGPMDAIPQMIRWPPGVPLFIALLAGVVPWGGHIGANLLAFAAWVSAVALFAMAARREEQRVPLVALFALTPFLLLNAAVAQDFVFGLAAALAVYVALTRRAYGIAGVLLGVGMALRLTNVLLLLPSLAFLWCAETDTRIRVRAAAWMTGLTAAIGLAMYAPFIVVSGLGWRYFVPLPGHGGNPFDGAWRTAVYNWLSVFGLVASVGILALAVVRRARIREAVRHDWQARRPMLVFAVLTILTYVALSFRFTMKAEYVMPAIPFLFLLSGRWFARRELVALTILVASYGVFALDVKGGVSGHRELTLKPAAGILVQDWQRRRDLQGLRAGVRDLRRLDRAVVLTGLAGVLTTGNPWLEAASAADISPRLPVDAGLSEHRAVGSIVHRVRGSSVFLVTSLAREHVELVRREGYTVYMFSEYAASAAVNGHHYDPYALRLGVLRVTGREAFYRHAATEGA